MVISLSLFIVSVACGLFVSSIFFNVRLIRVLIRFLNFKIVNLYYKFLIVYGKKLNHRSKKFYLFI